MYRRYLILVAIVVALAIGLSLWHRPGKEVASVREQAAPGNLFDSQTRAEVPRPRNRETQSIPGEVTARNGRRILEAVDAKDEARAKRLGIDDPARPEEVFISGKRTLRLLDEVAAVTEDAAEGLDVVERRGGYAFVRVEPDRELPRGALPAAYEPRTGGIVVLTGKLSLQLKASQSAPDLSSEYSMELIRNVGRLNLAVYQSSQPTSSGLTQLLAALRKDTRVREADLELIGERRLAQ